MHSSRISDLGEGGAIRIAKVLQAGQWLKSLLLACEPPKKVCRTVTHL